MATRSFIGKVQEDGTIKALYCHYDGYPEGVGLKLVNHFKDEETEELLNGKDIRSLEIGGGDEFDDGQEARTFKTIAEYVNTASDSWAQYVYLYQNGVWSCYSANTGMEINLNEVEQETNL